MSKPIPRRQADLFAPSSDLFDPAPNPRPEPLPPHEVDRIRQRLLATLALVRGAQFQPWEDLTRMTIEEIGFRSMCGWLPSGEAAELRAAFDAEMDRIYANEDARWDAEEAVRQRA